MVQPIYHDHTETVVGGLGAALAARGRVTSPHSKQSLHSSLYHLGTRRTCPRAGRYVLLGEVACDTANIIIHTFTAADRPTAVNLSASRRRHFELTTATRLSVCIHQTAFNLTSRRSSRKAVDTTRPIHSRAKYYSSHAIGTKHFTGSKR